jgi:H+/Cl- antiporter ClcA
MAMTDGDFDPISPTSGPVYKSTRAMSIQSTNEKDPAKILSVILLGALLGIVGQMVRVLVGLKKLKDASETKADFDDQFDLKKLVLSLLYASIIGLVAGVLMAVDSLDKVWDRSTILAVIAAGYAGVDFIEGFLGKNLPSAPSATATKPTIKIATPPKEGPIEQ